MNPGSGGVIGRIVLVCGAITAGTGALVLVGWAIGSDALTALGTGYIPAPNTALLFVLLGSTVLAREGWPASRVMHRIATAAAVFSAVVGSVTLIGFVIGLNIDDWLFRTTRMLGDVPMGRMSPVTALCFVLAGVSLLLLESQAKRWAAIPGTLITLAGAVCLIGYGFGAPLLYGGSVIPVALPTSLALVALGIGLTAAAGPHTWPLNTLIGPSTRARLLRALLPTVVLLALINDWIIAVVLERSEPGVVLASAITAISFLLVVGFVISWVSRAIGDAIDRTQAERKRAEEALRDSEERFRAIASHTPDLILMQDRDLRYQWVVNPQLGLTEAGMIGKTDWDILGKEDAEKLTAIKRKVLETGESVQLETSLQSPKGETEFFEGAYIPKFDSTGKADGLIGYFRNITERKRAEEALRMNETRYRSLFNNMAEGFAYCRMLFEDGRPQDFIYLDVNDAFQTLTGLKNVTRRKVSEVIPGIRESDPELFERYGRVALTGRPEGFETYVAALNMWLSISVYCPEKEHFVAVFYVITERKRAENELIESERSYRALFENMTAGFVLFEVVQDDRGVPVDLLIIAANKGFEITTGLKLQDVTGKRLTRVLPGIEDDAADWIGTYGKAALTGESLQFEQRSELLGIHYSIAAYQAGAKRCAVTFVDITERKRIEQALHDNAKRLRALSRRLFTAAETERRNINRELHDRVGQNLAAVNINLNIIRSQLPQHSLDAVGARIRDTQTLLEETAAQVRDVMADLHPPALDDYGLLAALHSYVGSLGTRIAVPITVHGEDLAPRLPLAAETALFRVAQGALTNAVTHARAKRIEVMLAATTDRVTLTIADDGVGFDMAHASVTHASWGLAIMRERAEAVGAALTVESTPGKGTRVRIEISRKKR